MPQHYDDGTTRHVDWEQILTTSRDTPRPLTLPELQRLHRNGFPEAARRLAAGQCPACGLNRAGRGHRELCQEPLRPVPAAAPPRQPWQPIIRRAA